MSLGTRVAAAHWAVFHSTSIPEQQAAWLAHYQEPQATRVATANAVASLKPESVVELGAHSGPLLTLLRDRLPGAKLAGVEINPIAARSLVERGFDLLSNDLVTWLLLQPNDSWDVIVTHYTLAYISPEDVADVLGHMLRVAKRGVVFMEPFTPNTSTLVWNYPEWAHPYDKLLQAHPVTTRGTALEYGTKDGTDVPFYLALFEATK